MEQISHYYPAKHSDTIFNPALLDGAECRRTDRPDIFFSDTEKKGKDKERYVRLAKEVCARCTIKDDCLLYALRNNEEFGIWGGLTEAERKELKRASSRRLYGARY